MLFRRGDGGTQNIIVTVAHNNTEETLPIPGASVIDETELKEAFPSSGVVGLDAIDKQSTTNSAIAIPDEFGATRDISSTSIGLGDVGRSSTYLLFFQAPKSFTHIAEIINIVYEFIGPCVELVIVSGSCRLWRSLAFGTAVQLPYFAIDPLEIEAKLFRHSQGKQDKSAIRVYGDIKSNTTVKMEPPTAVFYEEDFPCLRLGHQLANYSNERFESSYWFQQFVLECRGFDIRPLFPSYPSIAMLNLYLPEDRKMQLRWDLLGVLIFLAALLVPHICTLGACSAPESRCGTGVFITLPIVTFFTLIPGLAFLAVKRMLISESLLHYFSTYAKLEGRSCNDMRDTFKQPPEWRPVLMVLSFVIAFCLSFITGLLAVNGGLSRSMTLEKAISQKSSSEDTMSLNSCVFVAEPESWSLQSARRRGHYDALAEMVYNSDPQKNITILFENVGLGSHLWTDIEHAGAPGFLLRRTGDDDNNDNSSAVTVVIRLYFNEPRMISDPSCSRCDRKVKTTSHGNDLPVLFAKASLHTAAESEDTTTGPAVRIKVHTSLCRRNPAIFRIVFFFLLLLMLVLFIAPHLPLLMYHWKTWIRVKVLCCTSSCQKKPGTEPSPREILERERERIESIRAVALESRRKIQELADASWKKKKMRRESSFRTVSKQHPIHTQQSGERHNSQADLFKVPQYQKLRVF